jgi:hypothetical protein
MLAEIPPSVFINSHVALRIWFEDGVSGFQQFYPDQRLTSVGYSMMAANVPDGAITSSKFAPGAVSQGSLAGNAVGTANLADGAVTTPKLAAGAISGMFYSMQVFTNNGVWLKPAGVNRVHVRLWGGGGGGNFEGSEGYNIGGGGGYCEGCCHRDWRC